MTKLVPQLDDMITRISDLPDADIRSVAMVGFARMLPQDVEEEVELEGIPFMQNLTCVDAEIPQGRFVVGDKQLLTIDPNDQLPRLDFYGLVDEVAHIDDAPIRGAAFAYIVNCVLSKPGWVAW